MKKLLSATVALLALAVTGFTTTAHAQDKAGDPAAGAKKNSMCIGCHGIVGYQASFPEIYKVPMIAGQNAKYMVAALNAYKKGERKHPSMRGIAETLTDQDMADLAAYYQEQGGPRPALAPTAAKEPGPDAAELLKRGNCSACHGANFSTPIDPSYPKLSGQHADYLYVALKAYATQGQQLVGRSHAIMGAQVKSYSHAELKALSGYISSLPGDLKTVPQSKFK